MSFGCREMTFQDSSKNVENDLDDTYSIDLESATLFLNSLAVATPRKYVQAESSEREKPSMCTSPGVANHLTNVSLSKLNSLNEKDAHGDETVQAGLSVSSQAAKKYLRCHRAAFPSAEDSFIHGDSGKVLPFTFRSFLKKLTYWSRNLQWRRGEIDRHLLAGNSGMAPLHSVVSWKSKRQGMSYSFLLVSGSDQDGTIAKMLGIPTKRLFSLHTSPPVISMQPVEENKQIRKHLNEKYKAIFSGLHETMTMSKLRNLKYDLFSLIKIVPDLNPSTVALAWYYFEELLSFGLVHKGVRKQFGAACLLLAYKFHQDLDDNKVYNLVDSVRALDRKDNLKASDIFSVEFDVFAALKFDLQIPFHLVEPHLIEYDQLRVG